MRFPLLIPLLLYLGVATAKPPQLTPRDTRLKTEEILRAHATFHVLTPEIARRALDNFLSDLDPMKSYFIENEILKWKDPSDDLLAKIVSEYKREQFTAFEEIYDLLQQGILRRRELEEVIRHQGLIKLSSHKKPKNSRELQWPKTEVELIQHLIFLQGLVKETAEKLGGNAEEFLKRIDKRRLTEEADLLVDHPEERQQTIFAHILKAVSAALDAQTTYFTPAEAGQFMVQVQQRLFGIGAQLRDDFNGFTVTRLLEGGPAIRVGTLKVGDRIIAVSGEPIIGMEIVSAVDLIRGPQGSPVTLTVLRKHKEATSEEKLDIVLQRDEIVLKENRLESSYAPFGDGVIGCLKLFSFYQDPKFSSSSDLTEAMTDLKKNHKLKGIVLDLRNNAGGLLPQAAAVAGLFMSKGVVVSVKDHTGSIQKLRNIEAVPIWDGPLIILTNRLSASAAEIVAQTLQEYGRAVVVGDGETYGKGTFQTFTLESANYGKVNPKGEYKVTRGRYYTVSGKSPQLIGVKADIVVPGPFAEMEIGERFAKFPLSTDQIAPSFQDDLSDIPALHRAQVSRLYQFNLQPVLQIYTPLLPRLRQNSDERLAQNQSYQHFLNELYQGEDLSYETLDAFVQRDLQLDEVVQIMKDLIFLKPPEGRQ
jgi:carboxyl-terminal processing protease